MGGQQTGTIRDAIQQIAGTARTATVTLFDAEVVSIDIAARTAQVKMVGGKAALELTARLMAAVGDGILLQPVTGSTVTALMSEFVDPLIVSYSDVEKIVLLGGDLDGLVKVGDLVDKLNDIENKVNDLINAYNAHTHPVPGVTSGPSSTMSSVTTSVISGTLTPTQQSDIENENITQG